MEDDIKECRNPQCKRYRILVERPAGATRRCSQCGSRLKRPSEINADAKPIVDVELDPRARRRMEKASQSSLPNKIPLPTKDQFLSCGGSHEGYNRLLREHNLVTWADYNGGSWQDYENYLEANGVGLATDHDQVVAMAARVRADLTNTRKCWCECSKCQGDDSMHCATSIACKNWLAAGRGEKSNIVKINKPSDTFTCEALVETMGCPIAPKARIEMPHDMYRNCIFLCVKNSTEWIAYLKGHQRAEDKCWVITEMYFPVQRANGTHVDVVGDDQIQEGTIGSIHSHVNMEAFFSAEDKKHFNHPVELVINRKGHMGTAIAHTLECGRPTRLEGEVLLTGNSAQVELEKGLNEKLTAQSTGYHYPNKGGRHMSAASPSSSGGSSRKGYFCN